jgi:hypothetical protein
LLVARLDATMGTLALDIETASPFREPGPDDDDTAYFELLAVAVGYRDASGTETDVLLRRGGWDDDHTAALLDRLVSWCRDRDVERTLTYNGVHFDLRHLGNWAEELDRTGVRSGLVDDLSAALPTHVDLALAARDRYRDRLWESQRVLPLWKVCDLAGVDEARVWYDDYGFNDDYLRGLDVDARFVKAAHVGRTLGARYVDGLVAGLTETTTHRRLHRLLTDYAAGDVDVLFGVYDALGGPTLDETYHEPVGALGR